MNTLSEPVPVTGTTSVQGTVNAAQAGTWNVNANVTGDRGHARGDPWRPRLVLFQLLGQPGVFDQEIARGTDHLAITSITTTAALSQLNLYNCADDTLIRVILLAQADAHMAFPVPLLVPPDDLQEEWCLKLLHHASGTPAGGFTIVGYRY